MTIRINNLSLSLDDDISLLKKKVSKKLRISEKEIEDLRIVRESIDARKKDNIKLTYAVEINHKDEEKLVNRLHDNDVRVDVSKYEPDVEPGSEKLNNRPVVVGLGPAGLFSALMLAQKGYKPLVIERGEDVDKRTETVDKFWKTGELNLESNVQFGEGGAGSFSDGKLTTRIKDKKCDYVLAELVKAGAPAEIKYEAKPHVGTDILKDVVKNIRKQIIALGGEVRFSSKLEYIKSNNGKIKSIIVNGDEIPCDALVLALGHSSRDTFKKVYENGLLLEPKNFSVGVRIEHLQSEINKAQYGTLTKLKLPSADYKLAYHAPSGRSCYTFCMCPGGTVMPSSSEEKTIVTNGMSYFARDGKNANSAVLVNVTPEDFKDCKNPLSGIDFQKDLEEKAFILGGSNYFAPIQRFEDFEKNIKSTFIGTVEPSYKPGVTLSNLNDIMPEFVSTTLKDGIKFFDTRLHGFANPDSILTGMETRSSSPVRILRDENLVSNIRGIYPCGEGAGYAGGIMSASVDGIKCAIAAIARKNF